LLKVLVKTMDSTLSADKVELMVLSRDEATGKVYDRMVTGAELQGIIDRSEVNKKEESKEADTTKF